VILHERQGASMWKAIIAMLGVLVLSGCAPVWVQTNGPFQGAGYTLELPQGWMATTNPKNMVLTNDGPELQLVYVKIIDISDQDKNMDKEKTSGKRLKKGMLPQEVAEIVLDMMHSDKGMVQFTVLENKPVQVGSKDGFRLVYTYKNDKLRNQCIYYGMLHDDKFYRISYCATIRYYFEKDVAQFEKIAASFKIN
jgi:hypothetical protein